MVTPATRRSLSLLLLLRFLIIFTALTVWVAVGDAETTCVSVFACLCSDTSASVRLSDGGAVRAGEQLLAQGDAQEALVSGVAGQGQHWRLDRRTGPRSGVGVGGCRPALGIIARPTSQAVTAVMTEAGVPSADHC